MKIQFDIPDGKVSDLATAVEANRGRGENEKDIDLITRFVREDVIELDRQHRERQQVVAADPALITVSMNP